MAATSAFFIILMAFVTATLSGVFGMAGGLVLMGLWPSSCPSRRPL